MKIVMTGRFQESLLSNFVPKQGDIKQWTGRTSRFCIYQYVKHVHRITKLASNIVMNFGRSPTSLSKGKRRTSGCFIMERRQYVKHNRSIWSHPHLSDCSFILYISSRKQDWTKENNKPKAWKAASVSYMNNSMVCFSPWMVLLLLQEGTDTNWGHKTFQKLFHIDLKSAPPFCHFMISIMRANRVMLVGTGPGQLVSLSLFPLQAGLHCPFHAVDRIQWKQKKSIQTCWTFGRRQTDDPVYL